MEHRQRDHQPDTPDQHLDHVLAHHLLRGSRRGVAVLIVLAQQGEDGMHDITEQEPDGDDHRELQDRHLQVLQVDEIILEDLPAELAEVKHLRSPVDTQHDRVDAQRRHQHLLHQCVSPGLGDGLLLEMLPFGVEFQILADTGDGQDTGQLHDPPDEHLHRHERIACP